MLKKIRSKYIQIEIFAYLEKSKLLNIIQYSKKYQNLMNKKLKDYKKEFYKKKIEIIPEKNIYGQFINISNDDIKSNIKIYFNDNNERMNRQFITKDDNVTKLKLS